MYRLIRNGEQIAVVMELTRCQLQSNGYVVLSKDGDGIVYGDKVYNVPGHEYLTIEKIDDMSAAVAEMANSGVASIAFVKLVEAGQIDDVTAAEHSDLFASWHPDIAYAVDQMAQYEGALYRCIQAHTSQADWTPPSVPALWKAVGDPGEEWPAWSQPIGAHDAYDLGAKVSHKGKHYVSTVAANVWEPGVYGWEVSA